MNGLSWMRGATAALVATVLGTALSGCVVLPVPHARAGGVVVVQPGYGDADRDGPPRHRDRGRHRGHDRRY